MYRIGIDLGGTNIAVGLVNENCEIVTKKSTPTLANRPSDEITADMARLCLEVCAEAKTPITDIASVGIATPGIANLDNGCVEYSCNLPFRRYPIVKKLASMLDIDASKVKIANDANAAAYGEAVAGAARGSSNSIMVTLGTGVGGGIIIDGKIFTGFNHGAGEIGHIVIETNGALCGCGRHGCWEAYSSATALIRMTKEKREECEKSGVNYKVGNIFSSDIFYNDSTTGMEWAKMGVLGIEMESAALYCNAARTGKKALCICTISDSFVYPEENISAEARQNSFTKMMEIALNVAEE